MKKRLISFVLALVMVIGMLPMMKVTVDAAAGDFTGNRDWRWPVPSSSKISSCYIDPMGHKSPHYAIDISGSHKDEVISCYSDGTVIYVNDKCTYDEPKDLDKVKSCPCGKCGDLGKAVYIKYNYLGTTFVCRYGHLAEVFVKQGQEGIGIGQPIGSMGSTGRSSGWHLDLKIYQGTSATSNNASKCVDPLMDQFIDIPADLNSKGASASCTCCHDYVKEVKELYASTGYLKYCKSEVYPAYGTIKITTACNPFTLPCNSGTAKKYNCVSEELKEKALEIEDEVTVNGIVYNSENHYWYKVTLKDGTPAWVYSARAKGMTPKNPYVSGSILPDSISGSHALSGTIISGGARLEKVWAEVQNSKGEKVISSDVDTVATTSNYGLGGRKVDNSLKFETLKNYGNASYKLVVFAEVTNYYLNAKNELEQPSSKTLQVGSDAFSFTTSGGSGGNTSDAYTVTFQANGGTCSTSTLSVTKGKSIGTLPDASFGFMDFVGWFTEPYAGTEVTSSTVPTGDMTVWAHYTNPEYPQKLNFDPNGGSFPEPVYTRIIDGVNIGRPIESLTVFNQSGTQPGTTKYGVEVAVNSSGKVSDVRLYESTTQLTVPTDGFVLSGNRAGGTFVNQVIALENAYIHLNYETGEVRVFDSYAGYLAETKRGEEYTRLGVLPVPTREGYVFEGWYNDDGYMVDYYSGFAGLNYTAEWQKETELHPEATLEYNGHYYELYDYNVSWTKAKELCEAMGGHLVTITDSAEQAKIVELIAEGTRGMYRIGATDEASEGVWEWVTGEKFSYTNWDKDDPEPNGLRIDNYAQIIAIENPPYKQPGDWIDDPNASYGNFYDISNTGFICEYEKLPSCEHKYQDVVTEPSCEQGGFTTHTCVLCGDIYMDSFEDPLGHDWRAATCTDPKTCKRCGTTEGKELGHSYQSVSYDATCTEYAKTVYTCKNCKDSYTEYTEGEVTEWSETKPSGVDEFLLESKIEYRYQTKAFTTSTNSSLDGWTQYDSVTDWSDYGAWSDWSDTAVAENDSTRVETRTVYKWYYYECPSCGDHMHGHGITCPTWAGGCGKGKITSSNYVKVWLTVSPDDVDLKSFYDTGTYYANIDGQVVFKHSSPESKTQYRYCTREQKTEYYFYKWSDWSDWSTSAVETDDRTNVETRTLYRYADMQLGDHKYTSTIVAPTCITGGYTAYNCSNCGDSFVDSYVNALDHSWDEGAITKEPTEEATGTKLFTCERCGETKEEILPKLDHVHVYTSEVTAPTCTEQGYTTHTCKCGDSYVDTYVDALGHKWDAGVITKEPTEEATGTKLFTCERCEETREETLHKLDHVHMYTSEVTAPTCTETGYTAHACACGDSYVDTYVDALGHNWGNWLFETMGDCTVGPVQRRDCLRCGEFERNNLEAPGHDYEDVVNPPTVTEQGYTTHICINCKDSFVDSYTDPLPMPEANIQVARMILGNELAMQFAFPKADIVEGVDYVVSVTKTYADGEADKTILVPQSEWKIDGPYYYVSFNGIAAKEMGDEIKVQILTADGVAVGDVYTDSVKDYAIRQLRKTTDPKTRTLYVDMLNYGAAAQTYFGYAAGDLVTAELTETEKGYGTKEVMLENNLVKGTGYVASQLDLGSSILLRVKFNGINASMHAVVSFTNHTGAQKEITIPGDQFISGGTVVVINQVVAADYNQDVTIKVYNGDEEVANATESVASYLARQLAKDNPLAIYDAVAKYCAAAYAYLHK